MRDKATKERSHAIYALLSEMMRLMTYTRYVMLLEFQLHNYREEEEEATPRRAAEKGGNVEKWKVGLMICVGLVGLGSAIAFPFPRGKYLILQVHNLPTYL